MCQENLYRFTGRQLVREFRYARVDTPPRLSIQIVAQEGSFRLVLVNPFPVDHLFAITEAEDLWIYETTEGIPEDGVQVGFWAEGFYSFSADAVIDLDDAGPSTEPEADPDLDYQTGPVAIDWQR